MDRPIHLGAQRLDDAGLVAFTRCGHRWVYPNRGTPEQMHELARLNLGIARGIRPRGVAGCHPRRGLRDARR